MSDTKAIREKINATLATRVRAGQGRECELILQLCDDLDAERERVRGLERDGERMDLMESEFMAITPDAVTIRLPRPVNKIPGTTYLRNTVDDSKRVDSDPMQPRAAQSEHPSSDGNE